MRNIEKLQIEKAGIILLICVFSFTGGNTQGKKLCYSLFGFRKIRSVALVFFVYNF